MFGIFALVLAGALVLATAAPFLGLARVGTVFILAGFVTVTFNDVHPIGALPWMELCDPFFLAGIVLLIPRLLGNTLRLPLAYLAGSIGMLAAGTLSALATDQPGPNFSHLLDIVRGLVFLPIFVAWWQPGRRTVVALALAYVVGNNVNVVDSFIEGVGPSERYAGLTSHPNTMGICEVLSLALVPFLMTALPRRHHWVVVVLALMSVYGVWITGSRAAFMSAMILAALYPVLSRSIPAALVLAALGIAALAVAIRLAETADPESTLGRLLGEGSASGSNSLRRAGARAGIEQFVHHPLLGDGWLTTWQNHNALIQVAAGIGIFGLASYLALLAGLLRPLLSVPPPYGLLATPALATIMLDVFLPVLGARYVWVVVGLALSAERLATLKGPDDDEPGTGPLHSRRPAARRGIDRW